MEIARCWTSCCRGVISVIKLHASLRSDNSSVVCCVKPTGWSALHKEIPNIDLQPVGGA